jgi:type IV pilus assembly protein PilA
MLRKFRKNKIQKGFTLIEILIVVVIVAILAAISVPIYLSYVESARASDAKTTISAIYQASQVYYQDRGEWPSSIDQLVNEGYLEISTSTGLQWNFTLVGAPIQTIEAISTEQMRGGAGHPVKYDVTTGVFSGYGFPTPEGGEGG